MCRGSRSRQSVYYTILLGVDLDVSESRPHDSQHESIEAMAETISRNNQLSGRDHGGDNFLLDRDCKKELSSRRAARVFVCPY